MRLVVGGADALVYLANLAPHLRPVALLGLVISPLDLDLPLELRRLHVRMHMHMHMHMRIMRMRVHVSISCIHMHACTHAYI